MNPESALAELLDVSPQIEAAVVCTRGGECVASSFPQDDPRSQKLAELAQSILEAADTARVSMKREPIVQLEIAPGDGSVFVVTDPDHVVIAVTSNDPTVGLVFYDLKTTLRTIRKPEGVDR